MSPETSRESEGKFPTELNAQLEYLLAHWDAHGNLEGIMLPPGSDPFALVRAMTFEMMFSRERGLDLTEAIASLEVESSGPVDWDAFLSQFEPDDVLRALVEHGTPGAISLDMCPEGTLIATASEMRRRIKEGLKLYSIQRQRI